MSVCACVRVCVCAGRQCCVLGVAGRMGTRAPSRRGRRSLGCGSMHGSTHPPTGVTSPTSATRHSGARRNSGARRRCGCTGVFGAGCGVGQWHHAWSGLTKGHLCSGGIHICSGGVDSCSGGTRICIDGCRGRKRRKKGGRGGDGGARPTGAGGQRRACVLMLGWWWCPPNVRRGSAADVYL